MQQGVSEFLLGAKCIPKFLNYNCKENRWKFRPLIELFFFFFLFEDLLKERLERMSFLGGQIRPTEKEQKLSALVTNLKGSHWFVHVLSLFASWFTLMCSCTFTLHPFAWIWVCFLYYLWLFSCDQGYLVTHKWNTVTFFWPHGTGYEREGSKDLKLVCVCLGEIALCERQYLEQMTLGEGVWGVSGISRRPEKRLGLRVATTVCWATCVCWCREPQRMLLYWTVVVFTVSEVSFEDYYAKLVMGHTNSFLKFRLKILLENYLICLLFSASILCIKCLEGKTSILKLLLKKTLIFILLCNLLIRIFGMFLVYPYTTKVNSTILRWLF